MYKACYRVLQVCSGGQRQAGLLLTRCSTKPVCTVRTAPGKQHETLDVIKSGRLEKRVVRHVKGRSIAVFILSARMHGEGLEREGGRESGRGREGEREREYKHSRPAHAHATVHASGATRVRAHSAAFDAYPITSLSFCPLLRKCAGVGAALRTAVKDEVEFLR